MPTTIIGVDYSGAWSDKNTWVAKGTLSPDGKLVLCNARSTPRCDLLTLLTNVKTPAVAAMDFPFGVPAAFAKCICPNAKKMSDVWATVSKMNAEEFITARRLFMSKQKPEPKRIGDCKYHRESKSPLHIGNPLMLAMTYAGAYLLQTLRCNHLQHCQIPPMDPPIPPKKDTVTLLEVMPGAFLKDSGLRHQGYKGRPHKKFKDGHSAGSARDEILNGLMDNSVISLTNLETVRAGCRANDDCLDSVVAAVAAATWAQNPQQFRHPAGDEIPTAQLEGWIYAPYPRPRSAQTSPIAKPAPTSCIPTNPGAEPG